jgi:hypothetical protein
MNAKFKELMEQASAGACYDDYPTNSLIGTEIERFAELIVQECSRLCYDNDFTTGSGYGELIEEYFGVK